MQSSDLKTRIQAEIAANKVMVYSATYCPYCDMTKNLLKQKGVAFKCIELDTIAEGDAIKAALKDLSGQRTIPNIFINKEHIGGNSDLQSLASSGKLDAKLAA